MKITRIQRRSNSFVYFNDVTQFACVEMRRYLKKSSENVIVLFIYTHTHTYIYIHTHMYIYIYIYMCEIACSYILIHMEIVYIVFDNFIVNVHLIISLII